MKKNILTLSIYFALAGGSTGVYGLDSMPPVEEGVPCAQPSDNPSMPCIQPPYDPNYPLPDGTMPSDPNYPPPDGMMPPNQGYPLPPDSTMPSDPNYPLPPDGTMPSDPNYPPPDGTMPPNQGYPLPSDGTLPSDPNYPPPDGTLPPNQGCLPPSDGTVTTRPAEESKPPQQGCGTPVDYPLPQDGNPPPDSNQPPHGQSQGQGHQPSEHGNTPLSEMHLTDLDLNNLSLDALIGLIGMQTLTESGFSLTEGSPTSNAEDEQLSEETDLSEVDPTGLFELLLEMMKITSLAEAGISAEQVCNLDANIVATLPPDVFADFDPEQLGCMSPATFAGMSASQIQYIRPSALTQMTSEQFNQLPPEAMGGLTKWNMGNLPPGIIKHFDDKHLAHLNKQEFQQMSSKAIANLLVNLDPTQIEISVAKDLLPDGWELQEDGTLTPPADAEIDLPQQQNTSGCANAAENVPDFNKGFGLGGQGQSILEGINTSIAQFGYPQLTAKQNHEGILQIEGSGEFAGMVISLQLDGSDTVKQANAQTQPGVALGENGGFVVTTPEKQQIPVVPAPKDTCEVSKALGQGSEVQMGKRGEVLLGVPTTEGGRPVPCVFDQFVFQAPKDLKPGLDLPADNRGEGHFVYEDGTMQQVRPTVHKPDRFIEAGRAFPGVEKINYKTDGSLFVKFEGQFLNLKPTFKVNKRPLTNTEELSTEPTIEVNDDGTLNYAVPEESCQCVLEQEIEVFAAEDEAAN